MPKKLTYEFVKESFESEGYVLLEDHYVNNTTKMKYRCSEGHEHEINQHDWQSGARCFYCNGTIKKTIEFVKSEFEKEGYRLMESVYIMNKKKMKYICKEGHKHSISFHDWDNGHRCPDCYGNTKKTIEFVKEQFEMCGYELLEDIYTNSNTKMKYRCPEGHNHEINWNKWEQGKRCPHCAGNVKLTIEFVRFAFKSESYELLEDTYINSTTKMRYRCSEGHEHSIRWGGWQQGQRCPTCYDLSMFGSGNHQWKGGITLEPYCEVWQDRQFKADIKERDDNKCNNPNCWGTSTKLDVHHIDYDKKNCHPDNLITVCTSCNARANKDREWHTEFYKNIKQKSLEIGGY